MLHYRKINFQNDLKEIVELLRTSLSDRHTEDFFLWKHYHNPFGKSYGLLACDDDRIIGVRMFMFWEFMKKGELIRAIRPVDTITHPDFRGRGIFKKITLKGLEDCKDDYQLIFNTPNKNSLPGYLKMGWTEFEKSQDYFLGINFPFGESDGEIVEIQNLDKDLPVSSQNSWTTNKSIDYIKWRYSNPSYRGFVKHRGSSSIIIYKPALNKGIKTIVICEYLGKPTNMEVTLKALCNKEKAFLCYYLRSHLQYVSFLMNFRRSNSVVVFKDDERDISGNIQFSLGDLESIM